MLYKEPTFNANAFTCPYCQTYAEQNWDVTYIIQGQSKYCFNNEYSMRQYISMTESMQENIPLISISTCKVCERYHVWYNGKMIIPSNSSIPMPLDDMPEVVKELYLEAREVYPISEKSACAILRLAVQHLCKELGEKGKNINDDIASLVKKGLSVEVQKVLDIIRVVGNNAVHPGVMDEHDTKEYAVKMFELLNFIVNDRIIKPKEIESLYNGLPKGALKGIEKRDK